MIAPIFPEREISVHTGQHNVLRMQRPPKPEKRMAFRFLFSFVLRGAMVHYVIGFVSNNTFLKKKVTTVIARIAT